MAAKRTAAVKALRINNSYESEPSSGSGSSLSEINEGPVSGEEQVNLASLLKLTTQKGYASNKISDSENNNGSKSYEGDINLAALLKMTTQKECDPIKSSAPAIQETHFLGLNAAPYEIVDKKVLQSHNSRLAEQIVDSSKNSAQNDAFCSIKFSKFYQSVAEDNSCNAVDLPLPSKEFVVKVDGNLSFNGKIKNLTEQGGTDEGEKPACTTQTNAHLSNVESSPIILEHQIHTGLINIERSPDLFAESDVDEDSAEENSESFDTTAKDLSDMLETNNCENYAQAGPIESSFVDENTQDISATSISCNDPRSLFLENCRRERELYRRIRHCLQGVRPPPSVTMPDVDIVKLVVQMKDKVVNFLNKDTLTPPTIQDSGTCIASSLLKPTHTLAEAQSVGWREVLGIRHHGLSYNLNKAAEQNEYLSISVTDRYVGSQTATSYVRSPSSAKKRNLRIKMLTQSPGNRLSHLARRRAIFSSANLATNSLKLNNLIGPQIQLDKKKARNRRKATPKRKTPISQKKARKTPSSSARKRLFRNDLIKPGPTRETSKRALFQSPAKTLQQLEKLQPPKPLIKPEFANRVEKSKRALFSPDNENSSGQNFLNTLIKRKRKDVDQDDDATQLNSQSSKLFRTGSIDGSQLTPRALKIKSQSFCIGASTSSVIQKKPFLHTTPAVFDQVHYGLGLSGSSSNLAFAPISTPAIAKLQRAHSEMGNTHSTNAMTDNQRKKLLWAVSQALQEKKISAKHEQFRQYAADLTRIVKRIFQEFYLGHTTSNSETLLRLAKKYAYSVIAGKNSDDIYLHARSNENDAKRQSTKRLSGYIGREEFEQRKLLYSQTSSMSVSSNKQLDSVQNVFGSENSIDSLGFSQITSGFCETQISNTQSSLVDRISFDLFNCNASKAPCSANKQPIQPNNALRNSSSKNNLGGLALRENLDCERRSAQKSFTGKDQRNISPYYASGAGSGHKFQPTQTFGSDSSVKAKRQISFDS